MPINGDIVEVFNRTSKSLTYQVDGRRYRLAPGPNHILWEHVRYAKNQNPLMGSINPFDIRSKGFLIGVVGSKDPVSPIEQSDDIELLDRSQYEPGAIVQLRTRHINTRGSVNRKLQEGEGRDYIPSEHLPPADAIKDLPPAQVGLVTAQAPAAVQEKKRVARIYTEEQKQTARENLVRAREIMKGKREAEALEHAPPTVEQAAAKRAAQATDDAGTPTMVTITVNGNTYEVIRQLD